MKANPGNYEGWIDPNGGEWIRVKVGQFKDTIFRPANMSLGDNDQINYQIEFFGEAVNAKAFDKMANSIVSSILYEMMDKDNEQ